MPRNSTLEEHQKALLSILLAFKEVCDEHHLSYQLYAGTLLGSIRHLGFIPWDDDLDVIMPRNDYDKLMHLSEDFEKRGLFLQKEFSEHWPMFFSKIRKHDTTCFEGFIPKDLNTHQGIYIDVFPYDNLSDSFLVSRLQFLQSKLVIASSLYKRGYSTKNIAKKIFMLMSRFFNMKKLHEKAIRRKDEHSRYVHAFFGGNKKYKKGVFKREIFQEVEEQQFENHVFPVTKYSHELLTQLYGNYLQLPKEEDRVMKQHAVLVDLNRSYTELLDFQQKENFKNKSKSIR